MARGQLRIYLGAAPGVGKTYAMLAEGQRRLARGADVVGGLIETHGRRLTAAMAEGLEMVPRRTMCYRGTTFTEMDTGAVLARHPQVALVDELAHTNVPGCANAKRWQDVDELLDAGIDVITTLNIQHLESLSAVARQVTGVEQHETLPDEVARRADQIELVDMTPEALRRRMVHGNIYPPNRVEAALTHYFRPGNLTALRELALLWVADRVDEGLQRYRAEHGIAVPWETRERIVVGIAGEKGDEAVIRRAARIAARIPGSELLAVHVDRDDGLAGEPARELEAQHALVGSVGGSFHQIPGEDVPETLLRFARAENATQIVLGASLRGRFLTLLAGKSVPTRLARRAGHIDVHLVSRGRASSSGWPLAGALAAFRLRRRPGARASAESAVLVRLATTVLRGHGDLPALVEEIRQMFGLAAVSLLEQRPDGRGCYIVASAGERPPEGPGADLELPVNGNMTLAGRGRVLSHEEKRLLLSCAGQILAGISSRRADEREAQAARHAADLRSRAALLAATGEDARDQLATARAALAALADDNSAALTVLADHNSAAPAALADHNSAAPAALADDNSAAPAALADGNSAAPAALPGHNGAALTPLGRAALLAEASCAVDRVSSLVNDLGDLSRLHAGAVETYLRTVDLDEVLTAALDDLGPGSQDITVSMADDLPDVIADAALLTRILTSLLADALRRCPAGPPPVLTAASMTGWVEIRIADRGPDEGGGAASLAFRLARDLADAMGDALWSERTESGGRTVIVTLPAARSSLAGRGPGPCTGTDEAYEPASASGR
jgi:two-component system, OmpR family, sensor histidine kinase KdpD